MENIKDRTMEISREFSASVELVWEVLTTPEYIVEWWGPEGFTNTVRQMDVWEGGVWDFTMHGPDGTDFINVFHYREVKRLEKIVLEHRQHPKFIMVIQLQAQGKTTRVVWQNIFDSVPTMEETIRAYKADVGLIENIERLSRYLKQRQG